MLKEQNPMTHGQNQVKSPWIRVNWDTGSSYLSGIEAPFAALPNVVVSELKL